MVAWFAAVHVPLPFSLPHLLSLVSHTLAWQTRLAAEAVQVPFNTGPVCGGSVGMVVPLLSLALQVWFDSLHHWPPEQSASTLQPLSGRQSRLLLQLPERQTVPALPAVQGPPLTS